MSDMSATVTETQGGFSVAGYEKINYDFLFLDNVFHPENPQLAACYQRWGRVLTVMDENMKSMYAGAMQAYFDHHRLPVTFHAMPVGEKAKNIASLTGIVDAMNSFGIIRKVKQIEPCPRYIVGSLVGRSQSWSWVADSLPTLLGNKKLIRHSNSVKVF